MNIFSEFSITVYLNSLCAPSQIIHSKLIFSCIAKYSVHLSLDFKSNISIYKSFQFCKNMVLIEFSEVYTQSNGINSQCFKAGINNTFVTNSKRKLTGYEVKGHESKTRD